MAKAFPKLRGRIVEKYVSQNEFAKVLGISVTSLSYKMNGKYDFSKQDILKWCELLDISKDEIVDYFFPD